MMPNLGGVATIKTLRAHNPRLPIIAISGSAPNEEEAGKPETEDIAFLSKPFTVQRLLTALSESLSWTPTPH